MYLAGSDTGVPVLGSHPTRAGRKQSEKLPKPRISIRPATSQTRRHLVEHHLHRELDVALDDMGLLLRNPMDQFGLRHHPIVARALWGRDPRRRRVSSSRLERPGPSRRQRLLPSGTASIRPRAHVYSLLRNRPRSHRHAVSFRYLHSPARGGDGALDVTAGGGVGVLPDLPEDSCDDAVVLTDFNQPASDREVDA